METTKEILAILGKPVSDTLPREQNPNHFSKVDIGVAQPGLDRFRQQQDKRQQHAKLRRSK